jgi:2-polyprenyl-3-methyl-5-hydroxy-6-metoxy-1,4-benzoquinol methylase
MMDVRLKPELHWHESERLELRQRLRTYYETVPDYAAFSSASDQAHCWEHVAAELRQRIQIAVGDPTPIALLEVGAGRSGLGAWLAEQGLRSAVRWVAQDITTQNAQWLDDSADEVVMGDLASFGTANMFDIIVSTYVLEHTTNPSEHLDSLKQLLRPGGSLFVFCPRYDLPGYSCPSCRHLSSAKRLRLGLQMLRHRLGSVLSGSPAFLIQSDLAAFHGPFFTDADAVHWSSLLDLRLWARRSGLSFRRLTVGSPSFGTRDWVVKRMLTCAVQLRKNGPSVRA